MRPAAPEDTARLDHFASAAETSGAVRGFRLSHVSSATWGRKTAPTRLGNIHDAVHSYRVVQKLADGSAADVFLARAKTSSEEVIVEVLRREHQDDASVVSRFLAEAKLRQGLMHPNVTRRVGEGLTPDGRPFFITEPVTGESLRTCLIKHGPLALRDLVKVMVPICDALHYLHQRGMIHGSLKPANVYLCGGLSAFNPKLFDAGLALFRTGRTPLVKSNMLVEPEYMAPERIGGRRANILSDVYSLGLLIYEIASGGPPFTAREIRETRRRQVQDPTPPLPRGYDLLAPILGRCLAKEPKDRFRTAAALRDELVALSKLNLDATGVHDTGHLHAGPHEGEILGNYQLERVLGAGAMGRVFEARHVKLDRQMAIKLLRPEHASNRGFIDRFFQEARAANQINHEHIVQIFDFLEEPHAEGPRVYCVMELLQGKSLEQMIRKESVGVQRTVRMARQICSALAAAHKVGVIHRDIKPDNIFITERSGVREYVKVLDFGVAKLRPAPGTKDPHGAHEGEIVGTPAYMAPEQAAGGETDPRTDIYALGTVLYRMLAGKLPFRAPSLARHIGKLLNEPPPPLGDVTPAGEAIAPELKRLVMRCLEKEPAKRPQNMTVLAELLKPFEEGPVRRVDGADEPYQMSHIEAALDALWAPEPSGPKLVSPHEVHLLQDSRPARRPVPLGAEDEPQKTLAERPARKPRSDEESGPSELTAIADHSLLADDVAGLSAFDAAALAAPPPEATAAGLHAAANKEEPIELAVKARPRTPTPLALTPRSARRSARARRRAAILSWSVAGALCLGFVGLAWRVLAARAAPEVEETDVSMESSSIRGPRRVKLLISSDPPGARVLRADSGKALGKTPMEFESLANDQPLRVAFELDGYARTERSISLDVNARVNVELDPAPDPRRRRAPRNRKP